MRYLTDYHLASTIRRGNTIEQFLGGFVHNGEEAIRYLSIWHEDDRFHLWINEVFDDGDLDFLDVYEFGYIHWPETGWPSCPKGFLTLDEALEVAHRDHGASPDRWCNEGMVQEDYRDYLMARQQGKSKPCA